MTTWSDYLHNSYGISISFGFCLSMVVAILACSWREKQLLAKDRKDETKPAQNLAIMRRIATGMLLGYMIGTTIVVGQFILRFGYFSLLQEIGAVFFGLFCAAIGGLFSLFKKHMKPFRSL